MIKDGFVPDIQHAPQFESRFQTVRSERSERYGQKTKCGCNPKQRNRHFAISSDFGASPTAFSDRPMLIVGFAESFSCKKSFHQRRKTSRQQQTDWKKREHDEGHDYERLASMALRIMRCGKDAYDGSEHFYRDKDAHLPAANADVIHRKNHDPCVGHSFAKANQD